MLANAWRPQIQALGNTQAARAISPDQNHWCCKSDCLAIDRVPLAPSHFDCCVPFLERQKSYD